MIQASDVVISELNEFVCECKNENEYRNWNECRNKCRTSAMKVNADVNEGNI